MIDCCVATLLYDLAQWLAVRRVTYPRSRYEYRGTICSTAKLIGIHVVVGGWKSHVFAIQNTKAAINYSVTNDSQLPISEHHNPNYTQHFHLSKRQPSDCQSIIPHSCRINAQNICEVTLTLALILTLTLILTLFLSAPHLLLHVVCRWSTCMPCQV